MYNTSQTRFLRALVRMNDRWNNQDPNMDLELAMDAFCERHDIHICHTRVGMAHGMFSVSSEDLARIAEIDPREIPFL